MVSPKKNFLYNLIYQVLVLIIPLVTAPYLSRVVGADGVGVYSYTYSIVYYFMILTLLGVNNYGNRSIAKARNGNKEKISNTFWSIYLFQFFMGIIMLTAYIIYIFIFNNSYKNIAFIESLFVISAMIDINWFFFGLEEFKKTITRNTFVKLFSVVLIFVFVKDSNDLWKYTLIMSGTMLLSQALMWFFIRKKIVFSKVSLLEIKENIKPNFILFIPVIAISLYKMMDKIMLGSLANVTEVGYYENAEKIVNIPMTLITALGTVMLPRMSNIISKGEKNKAEKYIYKSIKFVMFMSFAMCFGLVSIGENFAPLYFGNSFQKTGNLIMLLAATLPFLSFANVLRTQYLIPNEKDKIFIRSVSSGAVINLLMNFIFIPKLGSIGACIGTISAEFTVMFYQAFAIRKELEIKKYVINILPYFFKALIMFIVIYPLNYLKLDDLLRIIIQVVIGIIVYGIINFKYITSIINIKEIINKILKKNNSKNDGIIKNINFYEINENDVDILLNEMEQTNFKFNNDNFLINGYYPKILLNNYKFVKYVIDEDFNNLAYIDTDIINSEKLEDFIDYAFKKVYYMKIKDNRVNFDLDGVLKNTKIEKNKYFNECLQYLIKMEDKK